MEPQSTPDVRINEVATEITISEGVGSLSPEDIRRLVTLVLAQLRQEQDRVVQRAKDTAIRDRAYVPRIGD